MRGVLVLFFGIATPFVVSLSSEGPRGHLSQVFHVITDCVDDHLDAQRAGQDVNPANPLRKMATHPFDAEWRTRALASTT